MVGIIGEMEAKRKTSYSSIVHGGKWPVGGPLEHNL
jgi:hypothetical protein